MIILIYKTYAITNREKKGNTYFAFNILKSLYKMFKLIIKKYFYLKKKT